MSTRSRVLVVLVVALAAVAVAAIVMGGDRAPTSPEQARRAAERWFGDLFAGRQLTHDDLRSDCVVEDALTIPSGETCAVRIIGSPGPPRSGRLVLESGGGLVGRYVPRGDGPHALEAPIECTRGQAGAVDLSVFEQGGTLSLTCSAGPCRAIIEPPSRPETSGDGP